MTLLLISSVFLLFILFGYYFYGSYLVRVFGIDKKFNTPAHKLSDGKEYIPTHPFYLFCQHFSAISASGPIAGPILACQKWGFLPCLLWISFGVVFIGAVHDFATLAASVRHNGSSIAEISKLHMGKRAGIALLFFIWVALIYIIVAFTQVTAATFVSASEELQSTDIKFNAGGAVAMAAVFYLGLCIVLGLVNKFLKPPLWLSTIIFVPTTLLIIWLSTKFSNILIFDQQTFEISILVFCAIASMLPIWLLLQPRGYLGGFILLSVLLVGIIGIFSGQYEVKQPLIADSGSPMSAIFPFLFVTIACGACSGFHGLICGGTTSKQIANENHIHPIGYGAMLAEGIVALIALSTIMIFSVEEVSALKPGTIYGKGIGEYLTLIVGEKNRSFATTFGAMAFSTFVFDTLDVATRVGRYLVQELFGWRKFYTNYIATALTLALPCLIVLTNQTDSWASFWTLFGSANQLLAALGLLGVTMWLANSRRPVLITLLPMIFILYITFWSLGETVLLGLMADFSVQSVNAMVALLLIILASYILAQAIFKRLKDSDLFVPKSPLTKK
jgi:carbon starvation protein